MPLRVYANMYFHYMQGGVGWGEVSNGGFGMVMDGSVSAIVSPVHLLLSALRLTSWLLSADWTCSAHMLA